MKKLFLLLTICLFLLCSCAQTDPAPLTVDILKIGQADAIILRTTSKTVMIDTGEEDDAEEILDALQDMKIDAVDHLIITHYDKDHIGSAAKVLSSVSVGELIEPAYEKEGDLYTAYRNAAENTPTTVPDDVLTFTCDAVTFTVYPPMHEYTEENDASLVVMAECGGTKLLFAGDIMQERIDDLLAEDIPLDADFLKVPHHGKQNDSSERFLNAVSPVGAVITSSDKNPADPELLALLDALDCATLETRGGNVHIELRDGRLQAEQTD